MVICHSKRPWASSVHQGRQYPTNPVTRKLPRSPKLLQKSNKSWGLLRWRQSSSWFALHWRWALSRLSKRIICKNLIQIPRWYAEFWNHWRHWECTWLKPVHWIDCCIWGQQLAYVSEARWRWTPFCFLSEHQSACYCTWCIGCKSRRDKCTTIFLKVEKR